MVTSILVFFARCKQKPAETLFFQQCLQHEARCKPTFLPASSTLPQLSFVSGGCICGETYLHNVEKT